MNPDEYLNVLPAETINDGEQSKQVAERLFHEFKDLDKDIERSRAKIKEIENRGLWEWIKSSSSKDMVYIAKSHGDIHQKMIVLIQKTIGLNVLSYAGLASMISILRGLIENGLVDQNGRVIRLSEDSKEFANTAASIFDGMLNEVNNTQKSINLNTDNIEKIWNEVERKKLVDQSQDDAISRLSTQLDEKERLDSQQSESLARLHEQASAKDLLDSSQDAAIEKLTMQIASFESQVNILQDTLEQHQHTFGNQVSALGRAHANWRWIFMATQCIPLLWLAYITWWR